MKILLLFMSFLASSIAQSQQLISTSGGFLQNSQHSISFSIGEPVVDCYSVGSTILTQGMQQPNRPVVTTISSMMDTSTIRVYPNPTTNGRCMLDLTTHSFSGLSYKLFDSKGLLIKTQKIENTTTLLSMEALPHSVYILQVVNQQRRIIQSVKITKF
jgi:hypothetical protein